MNPDIQWGIHMLWALGIPPASVGSRRLCRQFKRLCKMCHYPHAARMALYAARQDRKAKRRGFTDG